MEGALPLKTDTYKNGHWRQYPEGTENVYSYYTSRGGKWPEWVFFGLQYYLKEYLTRRVTAEDLERARRRVDQLHGAQTFNVRGWEKVLDRYGGYMPIRIRAVPEGTLLPSQAAAMTVESVDPTDPDIAWCTNYVETLLSMIWYPCTVATQSFHMRRDRLYYTHLTGGDPDNINFLLHDFGYRGSTSDESAGLGGAAHLAVGWMGSDNWAAIELCERYYGEDMAAYSIPAYEHSTVTAYGRDGEAEAYRQALLRHPTGLLAVVSDSYDYYNAVENIWGGELRDLVMARDGKLVIRPDSGDPEVVDPWTLRTLGAIFGEHQNAAGYMALGHAPGSSKVGMIQGDGIDYDSHLRILAAVAAAGRCTNDLPFGSGGGLLQKGLDRDTLKFAFKAAHVVVNGETRDVSKSPVTDPSKASRAGRMKTVAVIGGLPITVGEGEDGEDLMETVYEAGELCVDQTLSEIRARVGGYLS